MYDIPTRLSTHALPPMPIQGTPKKGDKDLEDNEAISPDQRRRAVRSPKTATQPRLLATVVKPKEPHSCRRPVKQDMLSPRA
ncbi:hypothetical protein NDU88_002599 [Pleurodeles waltl]|uniref:Uncharacterized protein n=1 Tax=Pleurodeles waltl TaxID=8319 RepID=A0AAV7TKZ4_PLEWA|nr:hypothetical protein NDU88_002599 [Pleurodeles waltl]